MANLAIKGHPTRGKEVIEILEMLGGHNNNHFLVGTEYNYYYIDRYNTISFILKENIDSSFVTFTIEEFLEKYPYKVGDKVNSPCKGCIKTITSMEWGTYLNTVTYKLDNRIYTNIDQLKVVNDLRPYKEETMKDKPNLLQQLKEYFENTPREVIEKEWHEYDKYNEIGPKVNKYLEYVNNIRQPKYPKTYKECHELMVQWKEYDCNPNSELILCDAPIHDFCKLIVARNIYWKIAGEQLGLGKPWEPDWENERYSIYRHKNNKIVKGFSVVKNIDRHILEFPSEKIQEAFLENFNDLIEKCKELLS